MERSSNELKRGWIGSVVFHILIGVWMFFTYVAGKLPDQPFVQVSWGSVAGVSDVMPQISPDAGNPAPASSSSPAAANSGSVDLPTRSNLEQPEEVIHLPEAKKLESNETPNSGRQSTKSVLMDSRESVSNPASSLPNDQVVGKVPDISNANVSAPYGAGSVGSSIGNNVSYAIQWAGGGTRTLVQGNLPKYPSGVNVEAQIKLNVIVTPSGSIKSAQPLQKGDTRLENAALNQVLLWKFEPLQNSDPQVDQTCQITFNFKLK
jgi:TonB family protein